MDLFNPDGLELLGRFWAASLHPDLSPSFVQLVLKATVTTLSFAVCGTVLSVGFGLLVGLFASEVWWIAVCDRQIAQSGERFGQCWQSHAPSMS